MNFKNLLEIYEQKYEYQITQAMLLILLIFIILLAIKEILK